MDMYTPPDLGPSGGIGLSKRERWDAREKPWLDGKGFGGHGCY